MKKKWIARGILSIAASIVLSPIVFMLGDLLLRGLAQEGIIPVEQTGIIETAIAGVLLLVVTVLGGTYIISLILWAMDNWE